MLHVDDYHETLVTVSAMQHMGMSGLMHVCVLRWPFLRLSTWSDFCVQGQLCIRNRRCLWSTSNGNISLPVSALVARYSVAEWLACWTQAQKARVQIAVATLSGNSLRQTVHTHRAFIHQAAKLVAAPLRVAGVTAGLAKSNGSLPPGLWLTSPAGWLPGTGISSGTLLSVIEYGLPLPLPSICTVSPENHTPNFCIV